MFYRWGGIILEERLFSFKTQCALVLRVRIIIFDSCDPIRARKAFITDNSGCDWTSAGICGPFCRMNKEISNDRLPFQILVVFNAKVLQQKTVVFLNINKASLTNYL